MNKWSTIDDKTNRFKLECSHPDCTLSICNLTNGLLSISTIHKGQRHSMLLSNSDMLFIISQYINALSKEDRIKLLDFYSSF